MKKIAFIMNGILPVPSVNGGAVELLVDQLLETDLINKKYYIDVYSGKCNKIKENYKTGNINYYYIEENKILDKIEKIFRFLFNKTSKKYIGNLYISKIIKKYKFDKYDYVIVENKPEYGLILKKHVKGKLILHSHNEFISKYKNLNQIINCYDDFFLVSKYMCKRLEKVCKNKNKINLLYNGIDTKKFNIKIDKNEERKKYGLKEKDIVFLYTGRLKKEKGILELIKAFNKIKKSNYKLLIVGSIGYGKNTTNKFTKKIKKLSSNNIIFTGFLNYKEIQNVYTISDYGIVPSICEEAFALTVVEHLASGHPVIITNSGGMKELVNDKCSIIIEKNENIVNNLKKAIEKIEKYNFKSKDCIEQAKKFNKDKYINNFLKLLEKVK